VCAGERVCGYTLVGEAKYTSSERNKGHLSYPTAFKIQSLNIKAQSTAALQVEPYEAQMISMCGCILKYVKTNSSPISCTPKIQSPSYTDACALCDLN